MNATDQSAMNIHQSGERLAENVLLTETSMISRIVMYKHLMHSYLLTYILTFALLWLSLGTRGVSSCSSLGWSAGWPDLYWGGGRIPDDIMIE